MKPPLTDLEQTRAQELLVQRATEGLDASETAELQSLGADNVDTFDLAAAAIDLASLAHEPMPAEVAEKAFIAATTTARELSSSRANPAASSVLLHDATVQDGRTLRRRGKVALAAAWLGAVALAIVALLVLLRGRDDRTTAERSPSSARQQLLASAPDAVTLAWTRGQDPTGREAVGDVVWSPSRGAGFLRFVGLAKNVPTVERYQLWIVDGTRDARYPVDGGLFDVPSSGEVVVPIDARIPVARAAAFVVTVEVPSGVVVSTRERIAVLAAVP